MSRKPHRLAAAFRAAEALSDDEKLALRDLLRPAPRPRQKAKAAVCKIPNCGALIKSNIHDPEHSSFQHLPLAKPERKPAQKRKAGKEATTFTDETVERCAVDDCDRPLDDNVHQLQTTPYYHEFVERKGTAANA